MEDFICPVSSIEHLQDYFEVEYGPDGECRPCRLKPLASLYVGALDKAGYEALSNRVQSAMESGDPLTAAKVLDNIKSGVDDSLRKELETLDCFVQTYKED